MIFSLSSDLTLLALIPNSQPFKYSTGRQRVSGSPRRLSKSVRVTRMKSESRRGDPETLCLPVEYLNGWLFGINASRVKSELREKIIRYQRDCYRVLWEAFSAQPLSAQDLEQTQGTMALEQIREMGLAIARMAEQQIEMEQRL